MQSKHIIPCGGLKLSSAAGKAGEILALTLKGWRHSGNVELKIEDFHKGLFKAVPPQFEDLLEIASYVYCADQATSRGKLDVDSFGGRWRRQFEFHIPVRAASFWNTPEVTRCLRDTLEFLSEDDFEFHFEQASNAPPMQQYFPDFDAGESGAGIERVVLFSGGLDSLGGAVKEAVVEKRRVMLVTHRPTSKLNTIQRNLENLLAGKAGAFRPMHLHVRVWKDSDLNRNYTQRTRSFLYAAVGATVSRMLGLDALRFYENGVVSLNLPVSAQVVGTRATRTTHPRVLAGFQDLVSAVAGNAFKVENDFIWNTKAEVIKGIVDAGCADLIAASVSCAHVYEMRSKSPHCGTCSQCIDRRMGMVAARAESHDPAGGYKSDVFIGPRPDREDRMMVAGYVERAGRLAKLRDAAELIASYPDVVRALKYLPGKPLAAGEKIVAMHRRHGAEVNTAIERELEKHKGAVRGRTLPRDCLLRLTYDTGGTGAVPAPGKQESIERQELRWKKEEEDPNTYRLIKDYKCWRLIYQGKEAVLADERAVLIVDYLLKNPPDEPIHGTELEVRVEGAPVVNGEIGGVIQEAAGTKLNTGDNKILQDKLRELKAASEDENIPESERAEAAEELAKTLQAAAKVRKNGGQPGRVAERVRKALRRFIAELKVTNDSKGNPHPVLRSFADHLEECVWMPSVGGKHRVGAVGKPGCFTYVAPQGVVWKG